MSYPGEVPVAPALSPEPPLQPAGPAGFLSPQTTGLPQSRFNNGPLWRPSLPLHSATSRAAILTHMLTPPESSSHCARGGVPPTPRILTSLSLPRPSFLSYLGVQIPDKIVVGQACPASLSPELSCTSKQTCAVLAAWTCFTLHGGCPGDSGPCLTL